MPFVMFVSGIAFLSSQYELCTIAPNIWFISLIAGATFWAAYSAYDDKKDD